MQVSDKTSGIYQCYVRNEFGVDSKLFSVQYIVSNKKEQTGNSSS